MGDSITSNWLVFHPTFFSANNYVGAGISGETTSKMVARFQADVIAQAPRAVVILAGTNDIAKNAGAAATLEDIRDNIATMATMAQKAGIKVVICSVLPSHQYWWNTTVTPAPSIRELNSLLQLWAESNNCLWADYYSAFVDERGGLTERYCNRASREDDYVHPSADAYFIMERIITSVLAEANK